MIGSRHRQPLQHSRDHHFDGMLGQCLDNGRSAFGSIRGSAAGCKGQHQYAPDGRLNHEGASEQWSYQLLRVHAPDALVPRFRARTRLGTVRRRAQVLANSARPLPFAAYLASL
jgi:hypothetical protein